MADQKISADPTATDLIGAVIPIVQAGTNKQAPSTLFLTIAGGSGVGNILFANNNGIDVVGSIGTDTLNIGTTNADVINIGRSGAQVNIIGTILSQFTTGSVVWAGAAGAYSQDNNNFYWNSAGHLLNVSTGGDQSGTDAINVYNEVDAYNPNSVQGAIGSGTESGFTASTSRGTGAVPVIVNATDVIGGFSGWGYTGSSPAYKAFAGMWVTAQGATASNLGGQLEFWTKADNGVLTQRGYFSNAGSLSLSAGSIGSPAINFGASALSSSGNSGWRYSVNTVTFGIANTDQIIYQFGGHVSIQPTQASSANIPAWRFAVGANSGFTAATEYPDFVFGGLSTDTTLVGGVWPVSTRATTQNAGTLATWRSYYFRGTTLQGASATAIYTNAYTAFIDSPVIGSNASGTVWALGLGGNLFLSNTGNVSAQINVTNTTSGTSARSFITFISDASSGTMSIQKLSTGFTVGSVPYAAKDMILVNGTAGNIVLYNQFSTGSIILAGGGSTTAQWTLSSAGNVTQSVNQNTATIFNLINTTSGTGGRVYIQLTADASAGSGYMQKLSTGFTGFAPYAAGDLLIYNSNNAGNITIQNSYTSGGISLTAGGSTIPAQVFLSSNGSLSHTQPAVATGWTASFTVNSGAHTAITATLENPNFKVSAVNQTWLGSGTLLAQQRFNRFDSPTMTISGGTGALTVTDVSNVWIADVTVGTGLMATNRWALYSNGAVRIGFAGTATQPFMRISSGVVLTTIAGGVQDGAFEYTGTHLNFIIGSTRWQLDGGITNNASNGELMMSNGTNATHSNFFSDGLATFTMGVGTVNGGNNRLVTVADSLNPSVNITLRPIGNSGYVIVDNPSSSNLPQVRLNDASGNNLLSLIGNSNLTANYTSLWTTAQFNISASAGISTTINGQDLVINAGDAYTVSGNGNGGNLYLDFGAKRASGTGADGTIFIGRTTNPAAIQTFQSTGSATNIDLQIFNKGTGTIRIASLGAATFSGRTQTLVGTDSISSGSCFDSRYGGTNATGTATNAGDVSLLGGNSGVTGVDGARAFVKGGTASVGNANGGAVQIDGGAKVGTGAVGSILIGQTNIGVIGIGGSSSTIGFFGGAGVVKQSVNTILVNNVTSGGTLSTIADFTSLTVYATDAATIRNNFFRLTEKVLKLETALRNYTLAVN